MYLNTFINLEENINGYGQSQKSPSGHAIICMPGMVRVYLQNLRNLQDKEYICYGLSKKDNKAVRLGTINAPSENKMTNFKIDINNIQGKGVRADNIDCIAIVIEGDTVGNTDTVMVGYVNDKYLIAPILEKGLPKKEIKPTQETKLMQEERKDKTPVVKPTKKELENKKALNTHVETPIQSEKALEIEGTEVKKEIEAKEKALNTNVETPIQSEKALEIEGAEVKKEIEEKEKALNTDVITPSQSEADLAIEKPEPVKPEPVKPNQPAAPGSGPVILPTPVVKPEPVKPNQPAAPGPVILPTPEVKPEKKPCPCSCEDKKGKKDLGKQIKEIIENLVRDDKQIEHLEDNIQVQLNNLLNQGISREELLDKKDELEQQIKELVNNKLSAKKENNYTRNDLEEPEVLEGKIKNILNEQFDIGYDLSRGCKNCKKPVEVIKDKDEKYYEKQVTEENETSKEEVDFLEQLEIKLKGLQKLLKTTIGVEPSKNNKEVEEVKTKNTETKMDKNEKKNESDSKQINCGNKDLSMIKKEEYERVREIFETSVGIVPFEDDSQPIDWVRISLAELISIPQLKYEWATQPFITFSYHKFNHLILGRDREIAQYYIGIPDIYHQTRGNILEIDKIERFICRNADKLATGEPGYWIAMI